MQRRIIKILRAILLAACGLLIGLGLTEALLRLFYTPEDRFLVWRPNLARELYPASEIFPGIDGVSRLITSSDGFRADEFGDPGDYQILVLGGSTTECLYLDQPETWTQILQDLLNSQGGHTSWVGNAGRSGLNARHHMVQVEYLLPQFPQIDAIVVLAGVNDFLLTRLRNADGYNPRFMESAEARARAIPSAFKVVPADYDLDRSNEPFYRQTAIWRLLREVKSAILRKVAEENGEFFVQDEVGQFYAQERARRHSSGPYLDVLPDLTSALGEFRTNLNAIIDHAQKNGVRVVLMTQPSIWREDLPSELDAWLWMGEDSQGRYYSVGALAEGMAMYNQVVLEVCVERGVECLDLASLLPKDGTVFYDEIHFNENGARLVASALAEFFLTRPPFH